MRTADPNFNVRRMRPDEVELIRTWATAVGWNPALHAGPCFLPSTLGDTSSANSTPNRSPESRAWLTTRPSASLASTSSNPISGAGATAFKPGGREWRTLAGGMWGWMPCCRSSVIMSGQASPSPTTTSVIRE
jgi:hypothetical protein